MFTFVPLSSRSLCALLEGFWCSFATALLLATGGSSADACCSTIWQQQGLLRPSETWVFDQLWVQLAVQAPAWFHRNVAANDGPHSVSPGSMSCWGLTNTCCNKSAELLGCSLCLQSGQSHALITTCYCYSAWLQIVQNGLLHKLVWCEMPAVGEGGKKSAGKKKQRCTKSVALTTNLFLKKNAFTKTQQSMCESTASQSEQTNYKQWFAHLQMARKGNFAAGWNMLLGRNAHSCQVCTFEVKRAHFHLG